jgi:hypothetical protein
VLDRPRRWRRKHLWWAAPLCLLLACWAAWLIHLELAIRAEVTAARAAGYPMTADDLRARYPQPPQPHAGPVYERSFAAYVHDEELETAILSIWLNSTAPGKRWPEVIPAEAERYLVLNAESLALLHEAATMGPAWFQADFDTGMANAALIHLRRSARMLIVEAGWASQTGQVDRAVAALVTMWRLSDALRNEPLFVSYFVQMSLQTMAAQMTEWVLGEVELSAGQLSQLATAIPPDEDLRDLVRPVAASRAEGQIAIRLVAGGKYPYDEWMDRWKLRRLKLTGRFQRDHLHYLQVMAAAVAAAEDRALTAAQQQMLNALPPWVFMAERFAISVDSVIASQAQLLTGREVARVGVAAARFRAEHGRWPNALAELTPEYLATVPEDPYADGSLRYRRTGTGAIIYSVGPDGIDHGGRDFDEKYGQRQQGREGTGTDITFTLGDSQQELWPR